MASSKRLGKTTALAGGPGRQSKSAPLPDSVRVAFVHGVDVALLVSAGIAVAGIVLALAFLPWRPAPQAEAEPARQEAHVVAR
jgi:hypothetical protein